MINEKQMLRILEKNGRIKYVELAKILGVTETAVRQKIAKMKEEKKIRGFTAITDPEKIGLKEVHIGIDTIPESYIEIINFLKKEKIVKNIYTASGDHMIMTICRFRDIKRAEDFIKHLENKKGVTKVCPAFINERIK